MQQTQPELMTTDEVALLLRVTPNTIMNWAKAGRLRGIKINNGRWRFYRRDVETFLES